MPRFVNDLFRISGLAIIALACLGFGARAQTPPPSIFFTDIQSGPKTGGENNNGVYITIYGNNLGTSPTVTVGGGSAIVKLNPSSYLWYQKMSIQLGASAATGTIAVTNAGQTSACEDLINNCQFTVRSGNVVFVAATGSDSSGTGAFASPWQTIAFCKNKLTPGDTCYVENGVNQTTVTDGGYGPITLSTLCSASLPCAILTYPGATSTIGSDTLDKGVIACANLSQCTNGQFWVIGGFHLRSNLSAADLRISNISIVGCDVECPGVTNGAAAGCFNPNSGASNIVSRGNEVWNLGPGAKLYHAMYFGGDGNNFEIGWNKVHDDNYGSCRGIDVFNGGINSYNISIHDNLVYNTVCDGINLAVSADAGYVRVWNNVVYHVGAGPDPGGAQSNYACFNIFAATGSPVASVEVFNNTFYNCGSRGGSTAGMLNTSVPVRLRNNIIYSLGSSAPYLQVGTSASSFSGSNNVWFGNGNGPTQTTGNVNANPLMVNPAGANFTLQSTSPAKDAGVAISTPIALAYDYNGVSRPQGSAFDIGALEYFAGVQVQLTCDINGDGVVNAADYQLAVNQALGSAPCGTANLAGDGCTVVDVQRVINAADGLVCRVGP